jgi:hypothetical protein
VIVTAPLFVVRHEERHCPIVSSEATRPDCPASTAAAVMTNPALVADVSDPDVANRV